MIGFWMRRPGALFVTLYGLWGCAPTPIPPPPLPDASPDAPPDISSGDVAPDTTADAAPDATADAALDAAPDAAPDAASEVGVDAAPDATRDAPCVEDRDCPAGQRCNAERACVPQTGCAPGTSSCVSDSRERTCDAMGTPTERDCAAGQRCAGGACRALVCTPGATSCEGTASRRTCNADGLAYTVVACPAGQTCTGGVCSAAPPCPVGQLRCGAACVDPLRDTANCGRCGVACPTGVACNAGLCAVPTAPMMTPRVHHALVTLPDGTALAIGGSARNGTALQTVERYDPVTNRWEARAPLPEARITVQAVVLDDGRVAVGGVSARSLLFYTPATDTWARSSAYTLRDRDLVAVYARAGRIYALDRVGVSFYDIAADRWTLGPEIVGATTIEPYGVADPMGSIYVFALNDDSRRAVFSTTTNIWQLEPGRGFGTYAETVILVPDGLGYGIGGYSQVTRSSFDRARRLFLARGTSETVPDPRQTLSYPSVAALPGGLLLVSGTCQYA